MDAENKRRADRKRVRRGGKIILANLMSTFECKMRNVSDTGALLLVNNAADIPDTFYVAIDFQPGRRPCRVAWRKMNQLGVEFLDAK
jgi:hypothetical protein